jgi:hypothetical protein
MTDPEPQPVAPAGYHWHDNDHARYAVSGAVEDCVEEYCCGPQPGPATFLAPPPKPPQPRSIADSPFGLSENQIVPIGNAWWYVAGVDASTDPPQMLLAFKSWKVPSNTRKLAMVTGIKARLAALKEKR